MAQYELQEIRAKISIGDIVVETPDVISFNVNRARNQYSASFSASIKIPYDKVLRPLEVLNKGIVIEAGIKGNLKKIFTGIIYKCTINPIRTDASKVILNLSGKDVLSLLDNQNINRRVKTYRDGDKPPERWAAVTNIIKRDIPQIQKFPIKIINNRAKAVDKLPNIPFYTISKEIERNIDRSIIKKVMAVPTIEKVIEE